jgi:superfamily II DNA or RNA helicase/intein/homing endonuclease
VTEDATDGAKSEDQPGDAGVEDTGVDDSTVDLDTFYDALEEQGRPLATATEVANALDLTQAAASDALDALAERGDLERVDASADPVVYFPADYGDATDRERVVTFPNRREVVVDRPTQFTRARLAGFAHLVESNREEGYVYELRPEDVWATPHDTLEDLLNTVRAVLGERSGPIEDWIESQWDRAHAFRMYTHQEGYVVLEARSADLLGNVAESHVAESHLRARISDTEAWVAEEATAAIKRSLYEAGYPVQDERHLETGEPLDIALELRLREYQRTWVDRFIESGSGVLVGPPGSGKTVAALGIMEAVGGETLVLAPSRELVTQWRTEIVEKTSLGPEDVGEYHGDRKEIRPVTVATYRTAGMDRHRALFEERRWGLVVYDEVHHVPSPVYSRTANLQTRHRLGLSVAGDTIIPVRRNGDVEMRRIASFTSEYLADEVGIESVQDAETLSVTDQGDVKWTPIQSVMRHEHGEAMYRVRARNGRTVELTDDHSLIAFDADATEIRSKTPGEFSDGDYLLQPATVPSEAADETTVDILGLLDEGYVLIEEDAPEDLFDPLYEQEIGNNKDRYNWKTRRSLPIEIAREISVDREHVTGVYIYGRDKYVPPSVDLDDFARLVGLFVTDGALDGSRVEFYATDSDEKSEVLEFKRLIWNVCPEANVYTVRNGENCTTVRVGGPLVDVFRKIGLSNGAREKSVPPLVLSNPSAYEPFLEGVILGDGHRQERERNKSMVTISTSSEKLAQELNLILASLGYVGGNYRRESDVHVREGEHDTTTNNLIRFNPGNADSKSRLAMTPFTERMQDAFNNIERYEPGMADGGPTIEHGMKGRKRLNDGEIKLLDARTEDLGVDWLVDTDVAMLEVDSVEEIGAEQYVYDIETAEGNFLGNHLFCHNSATPIREDDAEEDIFTLIGPPIGTDWGALFEAGYVAEPEVEIRYVPWGSDDARNAYVSAEGHERRQVAASNPAKIDEIRHIRREHPGAKTLIFVEYLDQGEAIAEALGVPFVSGETPHARRRRLFEEFRTGPRDVLVVSRIGDEGLDLPEAEIAIAASGLGGSRRQGAQRAGRTMRPVGRARMFVLATRGTDEEDFARRRTRHLAEKGVRVREVAPEDTSVDPPEE